MSAAPPAVPTVEVGLVEEFRAGDLVRIRGYATIWRVLALAPAGNMAVITQHDGRARSPIEVNVQILEAVEPDSRR